MHPLFNPLFVEYCAYFNGNNDYFECHEVLEEYWKNIAPGEKEHPLVGYVQLATGMYHWRRGNVIGAARILVKAKTIFEQTPASSFYAYINLPALLTQIDHVLTTIEQQQAFQAFVFPITNDELQEIVNEQIKLLPVLSNNFIVNKHMLRDRSDILEARAEKLRKAK